MPSSSLSPLHFVRLGIVFEGDELVRNQDNAQRLVSYTRDGFRVLRSYELIEVLEFDSSRKCMSVIVRHCETGERVLYTKGADVAVLKRARRLAEGERATLDKTLSQFALQGWRTLVFAYRYFATYDHPY